MADTPGDDRVRIDVRGTVQGVGFRPFVHRLATELGLDGDVRNAGGRVVIRLAGDRIGDFLTGLRSAAPPHARVAGVDVTGLPARDLLAPGFRIAPSTAGRGGEVPPDLATCPDCVRELFDPADRRHRYPFLSCTACGPRATILQRLPYDRASTSMASFLLCPACAAEYRDPADRRFHAEPIACPDCGPRLSWSAAVREAALAAACAVLADGGIVAVKGLGGYQLVCDAADESAVHRLRRGKARPVKPLAVLADGIAGARALSSVDSSAAQLLTSAEAPIVLLPRRPGAPLAEGIAPGLDEVGVFLATTPLHHLLLADLARPLVVTSGNRSGGPIVIDEADAHATLGPICDGILGHNRPIWSRYDDSVVRSRHGRASLVRRARGYAPAALPLPSAGPEPVLALGAQLKHTCTLARDGLAHLGPHTGDLENAETFAAFQRTAGDLLRWHDAEPPPWCAHDLHPGYLSTQYARRWPETRRIGVQHHHAHVAATAAEHGVPGPFVGVALDGLGLGTDGTFWGGEILLAGHRDFRRFGRFATAPMPGGAAAVRRPARMALGYLYGAESFGSRIPESLAAALLSRMDGRELTVVRTAVARNFNCPRASSAGRLFDAMSAFLGFCDDNSYEGEAAARLETAAAGHDARTPLEWELHEQEGLWVYDPVPTLRDALRAAPESPVGEVAARFHRTVAEVVVAMAAKAAAALGTEVVCLGGGVFQNSLLTAHVLEGLADAGLRALAGERVPMNDGGISYGQAAVACARIGGR